QYQNTIRPSSTPVRHTLRRSKQYCRPWSPYEPAYSSSVKSHGQEPYSSASSPLTPVLLRIVVNAEYA
ncbi:hypothetical protein M407DRAFT_245862, partial [Tulasnella calospora MUT 4182]